MVAAGRATLTRLFPIFLYLEIVQMKSGQNGFGLWSDTRTVEPPPLDPQL